MKSNNDKINKFLDSDMSSDEKNDFLKELKADTLLKSEFEKFEKLDTLLKTSPIDQPAGDFTLNVMNQISRRGKIVKQQKHFLVTIYALFGVIVAAILGYLFYNLFTTQMAESNSTTSFFEVGINMKSYLSELLNKKSVSIFGSVLALILIISSYLLYDQRKVKHTN